VRLKVDWLLRCQGYNSVYTSEELKSGVHVWTVRFEVAASESSLGSVVLTLSGISHGGLCVLVSAQMPACWEWQRSVDSRKIFSALASVSHVVPCA
jgi:hypothetical protein